MITHKLKYIFLSCISILFLSCNQSSDTDDDDFEDTCWTHSFEEENQNDEEIFRPCDYKDFPASYFRNTFTLKKGGLCTYLVLAPNDAHFFLDGFWRFDDSSNLLSITNMEGIIVYSFQVLDHKDDKLTLK